jgi:hypothetical protein
LLLKIIVCTQVEGFSTNARQAKIENFLARAYFDYRAPA